MGAWWKFALAALAGVVIAVPATVIARGGGNSSGDADRFFSDSVTDLSAGKNWKNVMQLPATDESISATVSAQISKGKAKFRLEGGGSPIPGSAVFGTGESSTVTFGAATGCPPFTLQMKQKGAEKATASLITMLTVNELSPCI